MATRTRDGVPGKEKRGTSPSCKPQTGRTPLQKRSSPSASRSSSPARSRDSTTTAKKNVPNYLKPTASSGNEVSKTLGKKTVSSPALMRRRSFDKPPSPSQTPKRVSPVPPVRSASFSGKAETPKKVGVDKTTKGQRDVGKQHSMFGATKKNNLSIKKRGVESGASPSKEEVTCPSAKNHVKSHVPEPEKEAEDKISVITENEELTRQDESKNEEVLVQEDQEKIITIEQSATETSLSVKSEEIEDKLQNDEIDEGEIKCTKDDVNTNEVEEKELEESTIMDTAEDNEKEIEVQEMAEEQKKVSENTEVEEKQEMESTSTEENEEIESAVPEERQEMEITATEETESAAPEKRQEMENTVQEETENAPVEEKQEIEKSPREEKETEKVSQPQQMAHGKKDIAVSNDVIEETASKLREQRVNRVRALAGAFQTVISLQETK